MKVWVTFTFLFITTLTFSQEDWLYHRPCFNDSVSAFNAAVLDGSVFICAHDLPSEDSLPSPYTRTQLLRVVDSCLLEDAQLYHGERQTYLSLNVLSNTGPISSEENGTLLFVSHTADASTNGQMGLFVLENNSGGWTIQQPFPLNSDEYSVMHPTYDEDNDRLYYTSNINSETFQLCYTPYDGEKFEDTIIVLNEINSASANDVFPHYHDGTLYFSSNRGHFEHMDLFKAELGKSGTWFVEQMKDSLMYSSYDDFGLHMVSNRTGFFATNRNHFGEKDELIAIRKPIDCSEFPTFEGAASIPRTEEEMDDAASIIQEFRNVFGPESEEVYKLNLDYLQHNMTEKMNDLATFYCDLFKTLDSASIRSMDYSIDKALKSEEIIDSLVETVKYDLRNEQLIDSLLNAVQGQYDSVGMDLAIEEQRRELKKLIEPLKEMTDSLEQLTDTIRKTLMSRLAGQKMNKGDMPEVAQAKDGLFFAVQVGALSEQADSKQFSNIRNVVEVKSEKTGLYHYVTGYCNNLDDALMSQAQVRGVGYPDAFIVAYCNGERIPLFRAKQLLDSGECKPIKKSVKPVINYAEYKDPTAEKEKEVDPDYNKAEGAVEAEASEFKKGLFYTVQIGVYKRPATEEEIGGMPDLITTLLPNGTIRYSSGKYRSEDGAKNDIQRAIDAGFTDAYVTAYYNGERIPLFKARTILEEKGEGVLIEE